MAMATERRAIIGDVHGNAEKLTRAVDALASTDRELIFVGDYINKGLGSREVIETLIKLGESHPGAVFLRGNHDHALLKWLDGGDFREFMLHGGLATIASYVPEPRSGVFEDFCKTYPREHREFLQSTLAYYERPGLFVSHAGYDPDKADSRGAETVICGTHPALFHHPENRPQGLVVFGHYVQRGGKPYSQDGIVCIDTGCGTLEEGPLTALLLPERTYVQF